MPHGRALRGRAYLARSRRPVQPLESDQIRVSPTETLCGVTVGASLGGPEPGHRTGSTALSPSRRRVQAKLPTSSPPSREKGEWAPMWSFRNPSLTLFPETRGTWARGAYFNASAPALATCASCSEVAPDTPTAPTILPSTMSGIPPSSGLAPASLSSRRLAPP